ncbi:MAG: hypothetical protein NC409_03720 [Clostridium sp.]|nr:hypothetical protein [Clostridium sp.]
MFIKVPARPDRFSRKLLISILFLLAAGTVCICLLVRARIINRNDRRLAQSMRVCEEFSEVFTASGGEMDALTDAYPFLWRDHRSISICLLQDLASYYRLEDATVSRRVVLSSSFSAVPEAESDGTDGFHDASESAPQSDAQSDVNGTDSFHASPESAPQNIPQSDSDSADNLPYPGYALESMLTYTVQDLLMFFDKDWQPCMTPQSCEYVLCVMLFEEPRSAGVQKNATFGIWKYDTMKKIEVAELPALTGMVQDDYFDQFSKLSADDALYLLDTEVYVP